MDIGATLEYLETIGVPVGSWTENTFPWFYSRDSGITVEWEANTAEEVATIFMADQQLRGATGMLLGVPLPAADALPEERTRAAIDQALARASAEGISGKPLTPYLLSKIFEITDGDSLVANVALIKNNASVGAQIASAVASR